MPHDAFRRVASGDTVYRLAAEVSTDWLITLRETVTRADAATLAHPLPPALGGGVATVTSIVRPGIVPRGPTPARIARGILEFGKRGLPVMELLGWGERRRFGLVRSGLVVTRGVDVQSVAATFALAPDPRLLLACAVELAAIHRAGLTHGDARLANFLATRPRPTPTGLGSFGRRTRRRRRRDLELLTDSARRICGDSGEEVARRMCDAYTARGVSLP